MDKLTQGLTKLFASGKDLSLLALRAILAYGFFGPAMKKVQNIDSIIAWFKHSLHLPFADIQAYLAAGTEFLGFILLAFGLATRFISVPLSIVMIVAITLVHPDAFAASQNGFEIPLYYLIMLLVLITHGAGKYSLDETFVKKYFGSK